METEIKDKNPPNPKPKKPEIKDKALGVHAEHSHWLSKFPNLFITTFNLGSNPFLRGGFKYRLFRCGVKSQDGAIPRITCPFEHVQSSLSHVGTKDASCTTPNYLLGDIKVALAPGLTSIYTSTMVKIPYFLVWLLQALLLLKIARISLIILTFGVCVCVCVCLCITKWFSWYFL